MEQGLEPFTLSSSAAEALRSHPWPGNGRQLKNVIERAVILAEGGLICEGHLEIQRDRDVGEARSRPGGRNIQIPPEGKTLTEIEAEAIRHTLEITQGNQSAAARILGISRPTIIRKMRLYGLESLKGTWRQSNE